MRKTILTSVLALGISLFAFAQESPATVSASAAAALQSVAVPHSPAADAFGGAGLLSTSSIAFSSLSNAAAMPFASGMGDVAFSYQLWQPSANNFINFGGGFNIKDKVGIGFAAAIGLGKPFDLISDLGKVTGSFTPKNYQIGLGLSYRFVEWVSIGANFKVAGESFLPKETDGYKAPCAFASDIFVMGQYSGVKAAVGVSNIGTKVKDAAGNKFAIPASFAFSVGYDNVFAEQHRVEAYFKGDYFLLGKGVDKGDLFCCGFGAGYTWNDMVSVKGGYHYGKQTSVVPSFATVGLGVKFYGVHIDATYFAAGKGSPMANTVSVGLGYRF